MKPIKHRRLKPKKLYASAKSEKALHQLAGAIALAELDWSSRSKVIEKAREVLEQLAFVCGT